MKTLPTDLAGVVVVVLAVFGDHRGQFKEHDSAAPRLRDAELPRL